MDSRQLATGRGRCGGRSGQVVLGLLALALVLVTASAADAVPWYESYERAEQALAAEDWDEAVRQLNAALAERPTSGASTRTYGMRFVDYFPYLKLGIAYFHLGQPEAALQAFETAERQGAVAESTAALAELRAYRDRIARRQAEQREARERRVLTIVEESLAEVRRLEREGRLEEALVAVDRALAVSSDLEEAQTARRRLLGALADRQARQLEAARLDELARSARSHLAAGRYRPAISGLREALEMRPDAELRELLAEAERALRQELEAERGANDRRRLVESSLARARELMESGEPVRAMNELEAALVLDPDNRQGQELARSIRAAQLEPEEGARESADVAAIGGWIAEADRALDDGDPQPALVAANRVLALDPAHPVALRQLSRAYSQLSAVLLADDRAPPAILLDPEALPADARSSQEGVAFTVRSADLVLSGTVYAASPVEVTVVRSGATEGDLEGGEIGDRALGEVASTRRQFQGLWITEYRWQNRLAGGRTAIEIQAADRAGGRSALPVTIDYRRPFHRTLWMPTVFFAAVALSALALYVLRSRRRQRLLRERFNPYVAGAPIFESSRFVGRRQLLDYVLRRVTNNSIMLYGERRIGKTSFQHQLKRCLSALDDPHHLFFPVFIDLQGLPQEKFFATLAAEIFHELAPKLGGMEPEMPTGESGYGYRELVKDLQRVLRALREKTDKRVKLVLLIDEVDELNHYDPRINQRLRSLFMRAFSDSLVCVVSGVAIKKQWEREGSPWYNFFQEIEVKSFERDEAETLIAAPVKGVFTFEEGVTDEIIRRTASKPYLIQRLCSGLVDRMHEERRRRITRGDLENACRIEGL